MSRTTHGAPEPIDACRYYAGLLVGALSGDSKETLLSPRYAPVTGLWDEQPLAPAIATIAAGSFKDKAPPAIRGTGYVVDALEAALWAFWTTEDFQSGALAAVNLGNDADTTGAIFGQLAGAYYGAEGIPGDWRGRLAKGDVIEQKASGLFRFVSQWPQLASGGSQGREDPTTAFGLATTRSQVQSGGS
jgi:ADP-ribosylglycohydrolase